MNRDKLRRLVGLFCKKYNLPLEDGSVPQFIKGIIEQDSLPADTIYDAAGVYMVATTIIANELADNPDNKMLLGPAMLRADAAYAALTCVEAGNLTLALQNLRLAVKGDKI